MAAQLAAKVAAADQQYALKKYDAAAELYSEATEMQSELRGEMDPENADLLYVYGRCLYHVAISKSDVLGGKVASEKPKNDKKRKHEGDEPTTSKKRDLKPERIVQDGPTETAAKSFFQITGDDEGWTSNSDEEDDEDAAEDADAAAEEEDDDFATAYEILDVARILLSRKLEAMIDENPGRSKANDQSPNVIRSVKERLADTHDLQAEISLENERFIAAIADARSSLTIKEEIYPKESKFIAEAHFKVSLALEFASVTTTKEDAPPQFAAESEPEAQVDENMRKEAAIHMEKAIESCKLRLDKETRILSTLDGNAARIQSKELEEVKEIVTDMEQRVSLLPLLQLLLW